MIQRNWTFVAVVILSLSFGGTASAQKTDSAQYAKAFAIAQAVYPEAQLIKSRTEKNGKIFGFYFWKDGKMYEIEVDATALNVVKQVVEEPTNKAGQVSKVSTDVVKLIGQQKAAKTKLPEGRLLEIASEALKDTGVAEVKYSIVDGKLVFQVGDLTLDAATGKPVTK